jgi:hypothetical protein
MSRHYVYFVSIHRESNIELGFVAGVHEILDAQAGNVAVDEHAESVDEVGVSATLVDALAVLQSQLRALNGAFDEVNFIELWRDLAVRLASNNLQRMFMQFSKSSSLSVCDQQASSKVCIGVSRLLSMHLLKALYK